MSGYPKIPPELAEKVARAMAAAMNRNPDEMVPETGYSGARLIPYWHHHYEWALRHIAAQIALGTMNLIEPD